MPCRRRVLAFVVVVLACGMSALFALAIEPTKPPRMIEEVQGKTRTLNRSWKAHPTLTLSHYPGLPLSQPPVEVSKYGGRKDRREAATGYFYVKQVAGRWWFVDPEGCLFYSLATQHVYPGTKEKQPSVLPAYEQKFGGNDAKWAQETYTLLKKLGFNSITTRDPDVFRGPKLDLPYFMSLDLMTGYIQSKHKLNYQNGRKKLEARYLSYLGADDFQRVITRIAKKQVQPDDRYLIAYFSDNELPFYMSKKGLLKECLEADDPDDIPAKVAKRWLAEKNIQPEAITEADDVAYAGYLAETYYRVCGAVIREVDPHHLYAGSRNFDQTHTLFKSKELWEGQGKSVDVASVNYYSRWGADTKEIDRWNKWLGDKPIVVTEWYAKGFDSGLSNVEGAGFVVRTQEERAAYYENFSLSMLQEKNVAGFHWFRYQDEDVDNEKASNKGIVNAKYEVYPELAKSMEDVNTHLYRLIDYFDAKAKQ